MRMAEQKISQLENILARESRTDTGKRNCYRIGYTEFRLSQLYKLKGMSAKAGEMLNEAYSTLESPECEKNKKTKRLLGIIEFYKNNPLAPPLIELPPFIRYLSPIAVLVGYSVAYLIYFFQIITYTLFFIVIFSVFAVSLILTTVLSRFYLKHVREDYSSQRSSMAASSGLLGSTAVKNPDDIVDDASAEISLAKMYYSLKDDKSMQLHIANAKKYLGHPLASQSKKKEEALESLNKLETAITEKKPL